MYVHSEEGAILKLQLKEEQRALDPDKQNAVTSLDVQNAVSGLEERLLDAIDKKIDEKLSSAGSFDESKLFDAITQKINNSIKKKVEQLDVQKNTVSDAVSKSISQQLSQFSDKMCRNLERLDEELTSIKGLVSTESLRRQSMNQLDPLRSRIGSIEEKMDVMIDTLKALFRLSQIGSAAGNLHAVNSVSNVKQDSISSAFVDSDGMKQGDLSKLQQHDITDSPSPIANMSASTYATPVHEGQRPNSITPADNPPTPVTQSTEEKHSEHSGNNETETKKVEKDETETQKVEKERIETQTLEKTQEVEKEFLLNPSLVIHSEKSKHGACTFQAHLYSCQESDIAQIHEEISTTFGKDATHNILLYNGEELLADNSGKKNADSNLAKFFLEHSKSGDLLVLSRWYGGKHVGPVRWKIMKNLMLEVFAKRDPSVLKPVTLKNTKSAGLHKVQIPAQKYDSSRSSMLLFFVFIIFLLLIGYKYQLLSSSKKSLC